VGNSRTLSEALTNTGRSDVTIWKDAVSGAGFSVSDFSRPVTLTPGQTHTFSVIFAPQSAQSASGSISFISNASNPDLTIPLSGTGMVPSPGALTSNLGTLSFPTVQVGNSQTLSETLKNIGRSDVTISQDAVSGAGFSVSDFSLPVTLTPGQTLTFSVIFAPQSALSASGSISFVSNASNPIFTIPLSGTGTAPSPGALSANLSSLSFASVQVGNSQTLSETLKNIGRSDVTISKDAVSGAGFRVSEFSLPVTLTPGQTLTFSVIFAPQAAQSATGSISFVSNASNPNFTIPLAGTGTAVGQLAVSPANLNFGSVVAGTSVSLPISLSAVGSSVVVNFASLSAAAFKLSGQSFPLTIASGQSVPVRITFAPQSNGVANARLSFANNAANSAVVASLTGTGTTSAFSSYSARTDAVFQPYPNVITCPSPSGCSDGGAPIGANYAFTPSDFPTTQIVRLTDSQTPTTPFGATGGWFQNCGGTGQANPMDTSDTRFYLCQAGNAVHIFSWNAATLTSNRIYAMPGCGVGSGGSNLFFSFTRPYIAYSVAFTNNAGNIDPAFCQYDFTSSSTQPTVANGKVTVLVDLATCVPALSNIGGVYVDDISVSGDDQTFAAVVSNVSGQDTAPYAIVWDRTKGCRVWNTNTGAISGSYGSAPTGTVSILDRFFIHGGRIGKGNTYFKISSASCISSCGSSGLYLWNIASVDVQTVAKGDFAHEATGYNTEVTSFGHTVNGTYHQQTFASYEMSNTSSFTVINSAWPPSHAWDQHMSWTTDNPSDTAPFCTSTIINGSKPGPGFFTPTYAWDNEILCVAMDGSGTVWRMAHTYSSDWNQYFNPEFSIGALSQDGKYYFWSTDWDGMLGNTDLSSNACTIGRNCRADVFMAILPVTQ
jgi:hypothetical protein